MPKRAKILNRKAPKPKTIAVEGGHTHATWAARSSAKVKAYKKSDMEKIRTIYITEARKMVANYPKNSADLHAAIRGIFGITIPYTSCSPEMDAPFAYFCDLMFAYNEVVVVIAPRAGSKTYYTSMGHFSRNMWLPHHLSVHAGGTESQARYASDYLAEFAKNPVLAPTLASAPATLSAKWANGSRFFISKSSKSGISGSHPHLLTGDEVEFWKISGIRQSLGNAIPYDRHGLFLQAQTIYFSTRQTPTGGAAWLTDEAPKRGFKKYEWSIFEVMEPCMTCKALDEHPHGSDDLRNKSCRLWEDCRGVKARRSTGWIPRNRVVSIKRKNSLEDWESQYLCLRPSASGLVYPEFAHTYGADGNYTDKEYDPDLPLYFWNDPAEGNTSIVGFVQLSKDGKYINLIDEVVIDKCPNTMKIKAAALEHVNHLGYDYPEYVVVDPHRRDSGADWETGTQAGIGINRRIPIRFPSMKKTTGGQTINAGISVVQRYILTGDGTRRLKVNPINCPRIVKAFKGYARTIDDEGNVVKVNPEKRYSDEMDMVRYGVLFIDQISDFGRSGSIILRG